MEPPEKPISKKPSKSPRGFRRFHRPRRAPLKGTFIEIPVVVGVEGKREKKKKKKTRLVKAKGLKGVRLPVLESETDEDEDLEAFAEELEEELEEELGGLHLGDFGEEEEFEEEGPSSIPIEDLDEGEEREFDYGGIIGEREVPPEIFGAPEPEELEEPRPRRREYVEKEYTRYEEKQVPIPLTEHQKEILQWTRVKVPTTIRQLVPKVKPRRVRDVEITHENVFRGHVGPFGVIVPVKHGRKTKKIGDVLPPRRKPLLFPIRPSVVKPTVRFTQKKAKAEDFYGVHVTQEMREAVVDLIFSVVSEKRVRIFRAATGKKGAPLAKPLIPGLLRAEDKGKEKPPPPPPKMTKKENFEQELRAIYYGKVRSELLKKISEEKLRQKAKKERRGLMNTEKILDALQVRLGKDMFQINGQVLLRRLDSLKEVTALDAQLRTRLHRLSPRELQQLQGRSLGIELSGIIARYQEKFVPSERQIYRRLEQKRLAEIFDELFKRKEKELLEEHKVELEKRWKEYCKWFDQTFPPQVQKKAKTGRLTKKGRGMYVQIQEMEERMLSELANPTLFEYLQKVLFPLIFLDQLGDVGRYAKFFQAKVRVGSIEIRALSRANLAYYFPELMMKYLNEKEDLKELEIAGEQIARVLKWQIDEFISLFMTRKGVHTPTPKLLLPFSWKHYLVKPQQVCLRDTQTGYIREKDKPFGWKRKKIPDEELVICFTQGLGFSCHSTRQVIRNIVRQEPSPVTGRPYPKVFVEKMEKRYPKIFGEELTEFDRELFGSE